MQFQVPQFIDIEDKIFGPLTFKQFIYVLGGAGAAFIVYKLIPNNTIALIIALPIVALALALAFYKFNSRPFINFLEAAFRYYLSRKLYIWHKTDKTPEISVKEETGELGSVGETGPKLTSGKLKDLSWSLDVHEKIKS